MMPNALDMLREDHRKVKELFEQFEATEDMQEKERIAREAIKELKIHAKLEEELIYPVIEEEGEELSEMVSEAEEEHHVAKLLMGELDRMDAEDERFDAKFKVLAESVKHHIEEEEGETFPKAEQEGGADFDEIGTQLEERKTELMERGTSRTVFSNGHRKSSSRSRSASKRKARSHSKK